MEEKRFVTIKEAGKLAWTPHEWTLRVWQKSGQLPGYYAGTRYYVDLYRLRAMLDAGVTA